MNLKEFIRENVVEVLKKTGYLNSDETRTSGSDFEIPFYIEHSQLDKAYEILNEKDKEKASNDIESIIKDENGVGDSGENKIKEYVYIYYILSEFKKYKIDHFNISDSTKKTGFYRGENKIYPGILASIFRSKNIKEDKGENGSTKMDFNYLKKYYCSKEHNYLEAYKKIILGGGKKYNDDSIFGKIDFYEMMQHTFSISPFLDLTYDRNIAKVFAKSGNSGDCCRIIYFTRTKCFSSKGKKFKECLKGLNVLVTNKYNLMYENPSSVEEIQNKLTPEYYVFEKAENDRMKVQRGVMLFLKKGIIINGIIPWQYAKSKTLSFAEMEKDEILIDEEDIFSIENLYDPYKMLKDEYKKMNSLMNN